MEVSKEELQQMISEAVKKEVDEKKSSRSAAWNGLRKEINDYIGNIDQEKIRPWSLKDAINAVIRYKLQIRNVSSIDETNVDQARQVFEEMKRILD